MATIPALTNFSSAAPRRSVRSEWIPVLCALGFVAFTSTTFMGGSNTQIWLTHLWKSFFGNWNLQWLGPMNGIGRKVGHFFGYGSIGLLFRKAWYSTMRAYAIAFGSRLVFLSAMLGVASTFFLASLDEWHQRFLPGRVGCVRDVMVDTIGALFLTLVLWAGRVIRRRRMLKAC